MAPDFEFNDYSVRVIAAMNDALVAGLEAAAGELESITSDNSRQGHSYGDILATDLWKHEVDEETLTAYVGSEHEAAYWEEFGTGEHAVDKSKSRNCWWVYVEGGEYRGGGKDRTEAEAKAVAASLRAKGKTAYATNGIEPNRPLQRAFSSSKATVQAIIQDHLGGME